MKRGQAGTEYFVLVGIVIFAALLVALFFQQQTIPPVRESSSRLAVIQLADAADLLYAQGVGSQTTITIYVPSGVSSALLSGNEVLLRSYTSSGQASDIYRYTKASLTPVNLYTPEGPYTCTLKYTSDGNITVTGCASPVPTPGPNPNMSVVSYAYSTASDNLRYRVYDGSSGWGGETDLDPAASSSVTWQVLKASPVRNEMVLATGNDDKGTIEARVWNGSSWGNFLTLSASLGGSFYRQFDLAYQSNGNAMLAYQNLTNPNPPLPYYVIWNGSAWSAPAAAIAPQNDLSASWLRLVAMHNSTNLTLAGLYYKVGPPTTYWVFAEIYNGTAWGHLGQIQSRADWQNQGYQYFDAAFESNSGRVMVVTGDPNLGTGIQTMMFSNGSWVGGNANSLPLSPSIWTKLASDPYSNRIILLSNDLGHNLYSQTWNGASWDATTLLTSSLANYDTGFNWPRTFDAAYQNSSQALAAYYNTTSKKLAYRFFNYPNWGAESNVSTTNVEWLSLAANTSGSDMQALLTVTNSTLSEQRWNGTSWSGIEWTAGSVLNQISPLSEVAAGAYRII